MDDGREELGAEICFSASLALCCVLVVSGSLLRSLGWSLCSTTVPNSEYDGCSGAFLEERVLPVCSDTGSSDENEGNVCATMNPNEGEDAADESDEDKDGEDEPGKDEHPRLLLFAAGPPLSPPRLMNRLVCFLDFEPPDGDEERDLRATTALRRRPTLLLKAANRCCLGDSTGGASKPADITDPGSGVCCPAGCCVWEVAVSGAKRPNADSCW